MEFKAGLVAPFYGVDNNNFKLGDTVFEAQEDEDDGYRSCMSDVFLVSGEGKIFFHTPIAFVRVDERTVPLGSYSEGFEGYDLVDVLDGHIWLTFGTDNVGDYYPCFTFHYEPKPPVESSDAARVLAEFAERDRKQKEIEDAEKALRQKEADRLAELRQVVEDEFSHTMDALNEEYRKVLDAQERYRTAAHEAYEKKIEALRQIR